MKAGISRRQFLKDATSVITTGGAGMLLGVRFLSDNASGRELAQRSTKRIFVAGFSHETNTFHPVRTTSFYFSKTSIRPLPGWKDAGLIIVPGISAHPSGGGTIEEKACRDAMNRVLNSLCSNMPVDAVFLQLHGAMYAEGIGPAETVLLGEVRSLVGPKIPIACTFDLHGNIPARFGPRFVPYRMSCAFP
jgi:hypothetical protein